MNTTTIKPITNKTNSLKEVLETNPSNIKETVLPGTDELEQLGNDTISKNLDVLDSKTGTKEYSNKETERKEDEEKEEEEADKEENTGRWQVMTNKAKLILRLEREHRIYAREDWQSSYFNPYPSRIVMSACLIQAV